MKKFNKKLILVLSTTTLAASAFVATASTLTSCASATIVSLESDTTVLNQTKNVASIKAQSCKFIRKRWNSLIYFTFYRGKFSSNFHT